MLIFGISSFFCIKTAESGATRQNNHNKANALYKMQILQKRRPKALTFLFAHLKIVI